MVNQHLLIVFGDPEDDRVRRLMDIRYNDADFRPVRDEFRFMAIATDKSRWEAAEALADLLDESLDDALKRAEAERKRVIVQETAT